MVFSRWDPENRVRGEILRILVVGELRGVVFNLLLGFLRKTMSPSKTPATYYIWGFPIFSSFSEAPMSRVYTRHL